MTTKKKVIDDSKVLQVAPVDACLAFVKQAKTAFGVQTPALSKIAKRHVAKPLPGSPDVVKSVGRLVTEQGVAIPKHSVGTMLQNLQTAQTLAPLKAAVLAFQKNVDDAILTANGEAWASATAFYTVLRRVQGRDAELEAALAPLATFFKKSRTSSKTSTATATTKTAKKASSKKTATASTAAAAPQGTTSEPANAGSAASPSDVVAAHSGAAPAGGASTSHA